MRKQSVEAAYNFLLPQEYSKYSQNVYSHLCLHRINLVDAAEVRQNPQLVSQVGSKSGLALVDSDSQSILVPPGSSVEVDFWWFGGRQGVLTHGNPKLSEYQQYPSIEDFFCAWQIKRQAEQRQGHPHGTVLANLKTHGAEEELLLLAELYGLAKSEICFLDQELPACDRLLRGSLSQQHEYSPVSIRISRIEPLEGLLAILRQGDIFAKPQAFFYDPVGYSPDSKQYSWPFPADLVAEVFQRAADINFYLCCPTRWGKELRTSISPLANQLRNSGLATPRVMTDLECLEIWSEIIETW